MSKELSKLFLGRAETIRKFCDRVGSTRLTADQGIQLAEKLEVKISSLPGILSRVRPVIKVKISFTEIERKLHPGPPDPDRKKLYNYFPRAGDQGDPASGFCPRCEKLSGRKVALTRDEENFVYCAGCAWEEEWEANGLPLTATI
jgi:hypothetical protein